MCNFEDLDSSSLNKCPKPSGQAFRTPPPNGQCPNVGGDNANGSSLREAFIKWFLVERNPLLDTSIHLVTQMCDISGEVSIFVAFFKVPCINIPLFCAYEFVKVDDFLVVVKNVWLFKLSWESSFPDDSVSEREDNPPEMESLSWQPLPLSPPLLYLVIS